MHHHIQLLIDSSTSIVSMVMLALVKKSIQHKYDRKTGNLMGEVRIA
jgi:hypothetical protein